ncbi:MAG: hypothetical protein IT545_12065 [Rhodobacteraceae bacterium]|nr:hypothetical protein [Paracoccaceae bacterium]
MDRKRKLAIVFATVAVAAGSAHLMQSGRGAEAAVTALRVVPSATPAGPADPAGGPPPAALAAVAVPTVAPALLATVAAEPAAGPAAAGLPAPAAVPSSAAADAAPAPAVDLASLAGAADRGATLPDVAPAVVPAARDCTPVLTLLPAPRAMIDVVLAAPCDGEARVLLRHAGLVVTGRTRPDGSLALALPALAEEARVSVTLPGPVVAEAAVAIPGLAAWDRVAVQWQAPDLFQLHAFEGGAGYGAPGHVYAGAPDGTSVFMTLLGDGAVERPMLAEVLTMPRGALAEGTLRVTIEAPVTAATCGRDLLAEVVAVRDGDPVKATELVLAAPDCTATGDYLVMPWDPAPARLAGN